MVVGVTITLLECNLFHTPSNTMSMVTGRNPLGVCPKFAGYNTFRKEDLYLVCENSVYTLWFGVRGGDDVQGTIYALGYFRNDGNNFDSNSNDGTKIIVTREDLEGFARFVKHPSIPAIRRFKHGPGYVCIGVVDTMDCLPTYDPLRLWIIEGDRKELARLSKQVFNHLDLMKPYMTTKRYERVTSVNNVHVLRVLVDAYQRWVADGPYPYEVARFEEFLLHNGLEVGKTVTPSDYITPPLTDVRDLKGDRLLPSIGWFVHNATCVGCSSILDVNNNNLSSCQ